MLQIEREVVRRQNDVSSNEIENQRLEQLHIQLQSINLQATLVLGFNLVLFCQDNIARIADDESKFCLFKQPVVSSFYIMLTIISMGSCMICVGLSFYLIVVSQRTANEVSVVHTVALVRQLRHSYVGNAFKAGVFAFFSSLLLLVWMYIGHASKQCPGRPKQAQAKQAQAKPTPCPQPASGAPTAVMRSPPQTGCRSRADLATRRHVGLQGVRRTVLPARAQGFI